MFKYVHKNVFVFSLPTNTLFILDINSEQTDWENSSNAGLVARDNSSKLNVILPQTKE